MAKHVHYWADLDKPQLWRWRCVKDGCPIPFAGGGPQTLGKTTEDALAHIVAAAEEAGKD